jgi:hypothetical protein
MCYSEASSRNGPRLLVKNRLSDNVGGVKYVLHTVA